MIAKRIAAIMALSLPVSAAVAQPLDLMEYVCERGVPVSAVYVNGTTAGKVVLMVEGTLVPLASVPVAEGVRYQSSPASSDYVWWVNGANAMLGWYDAQTGDETTILGKCRKVME